MIIMKIAVIIILGLIPFLFGACSSPQPSRPPDPKLNSLSGAGRRAYQGGEFEAGAQFYRRALERAREMDDPDRIGTSAYNLALCRYLMGEFDSILPLLKEARFAYRREGEIPADLILLEARTAFRMGEIDRARELAGEGLRREDEADRADFLILLGTISLAGGEPDAAREYLEEARDVLDDPVPPLQEADISGLEGAIREAEGKFAAAGLAFDRRAEAFREAGRYRQMAAALGSAGNAYRHVPDPQKAGDRYFRAARSLFARGDAAAALKMLKPALDEAGASGDEYLRKRTVELFNEIEGEL